MCPIVIIVFYFSLKPFHQYLRYASPISHSKTFSIQNQLICGFNALFSIFAIFLLFLLHLKPGETTPATFCPFSDNLPFEPFIPQWSIVIPYKQTLGKTSISPVSSFLPQNLIKHKRICIISTNPFFIYSCISLIRSIGCIMSLLKRNKYSLCYVHTIISFLSGCLEYPLTEHIICKDKFTFYHRIEHYLRGKALLSSSDAMTIM